jgi:Phosphodiester glycosidase
MCISGLGFAYRHTSSQVTILMMTISSRYCVVSLFLICFVAGPVGLRAQENAIDWAPARELAPGLRYIRISEAMPRKMVVHGIQADSQVPGFRLHTTPRKDDWIEGKEETTRQTTRNFMRRCRDKGEPLIIAINADAFSPWPAPFAEESPTDIQGLAITDGAIVSLGNNSPSLLVDNAGKLQIAQASSAKDVPSGISMAVSGFGMCLVDGQVADSGDDIHPRTAIGLSKDDRYLFLVVIDGRQPDSAGATVSEVGNWLKRMGAHNGINMDGGGSSTLAYWNSEIQTTDKSELLNRPVGNGKDLSVLPAFLFSPTERANGNNLGISIR